MPSHRVKIRADDEAHPEVGRRVDHLVFSREELEHVLGSSEVGTYEVTVERVPPRAARINIAPSHEGQWYPYICGHCGGLLNNTQVTCDRCGRTLGQVKELADLRIGGNGEPLVTGEE